MIVNQAFSDQRRSVPDDTGQRPYVLSDLRVALMWHGDTANCAFYEALADFADFGALQIVDLVPNLITGGSDQREQVEPFSLRVTGGRPRNRRRVQAELCQEALLQFQRTRPE